MDTPFEVPQIPPPADVAHPPPDAVARLRPDVPAAGTILVSKAVSAASGGHRPGPRDVVTVRYTAWTSDGATIDSSASRGKPSVWALDEISEGLRLGILAMAIGETHRMWIPRAAAPEWASGPLVFDVTLVQIAPAPDAPAPEDLKAAPADAARASSGLAWKILRAGRGTDRPRATSTVTIQYSAWTAEHHLFDDSVTRGAPTTVAVDTLVPGVSEALQRMVVGEKSRFWIPAALGYTQPGPPATTLVFDVELLDIQRAAPGQPGTIHVQSNSPDAPFELVQPDGVTLAGKGSQTFTTAPGHYRIKPEKMRSYALGIVASPADMVLTAGGTVTITITYRPIIR
ncbi:MAG: FKBP-type peptidyl-prolyl cis-trans isomerase [Vicinamibacterales bacterium]